MNTYLIPREMHDENRFLIFSKVSAIFVLIGIGIGSVLYIPFYLFYSALGIAWINYIGITLLIVITLIFWALGTFKIPETNAFAILKKTGGESVYDIFKRVMKFRKTRKIYY